MYSIRATKLENSSDSKVIGLASMVVDEKFAFNSIKVVKSDNTSRGFFLSMPSYKKKDGTYVEHFHPVSTDMVNAMCDAVSKSLATGEKVSFGDGPSKISVYVDACDYGATKGNVSMRIGKDFVCDSIKVMSNEEGKLFVGMPTYKTKEDERKQLCNPITAEYREELFGDILEKQEKSVKSKLNSTTKKDVSYTVATDAVKKSI